MKLTNKEYKNGKVNWRNTDDYTEEELRELARRLNLDKEKREY